MSKNTRPVLALWEHTTLTQKQIADVLKISESTVSLVLKSREKLTRESETYAVVPQEKIRRIYASFKPCRSTDCLFRGTKSRHGKEVPCECVRKISSNNLKTDHLTLLLGALLRSSKPLDIIL